MDHRYSLCAYVLLNSLSGDSLYSQKRLRENIMWNKERLALLFLAVLLVCSIFTGCSAKKNHTDELSNSTWNIADAEPEYLTQWPDNAFTEKIVQPQSGSVDYVLDYTDSGRYAIFIKDISSKESEQYVQELKDSGYSEINSAANDVSVGTMLEKGDAYLSVSYSDGVLGVFITLREKMN